MFARSQGQERVRSRRAERRVIPLTFPISAPVEYDGKLAYPTFSDSVTIQPLQLHSKQLSSRSSRPNSSRLHNRQHTSHLEGTFLHVDKPPQLNLTQTTSRSYSSSGSATLRSNQFFEEPEWVQTDRGFSAVPPLNATSPTHLARHHKRPPHPKLSKQWKRPMKGPAYTAQMRPIVQEAINSLLSDTKRKQQEFETDLDSNDSLDNHRTTTPCDQPSHQQLITKPAKTQQKIHQRSFTEAAKTQNEHSDSPNHSAKLSPSQIFPQIDFNNSIYEKFNKRAKQRFDERYGSTSYIDRTRLKSAPLRQHPQKDATNEPQKPSIVFLRLPQTASEEKTPERTNQFQSQPIIHQEEVGSPIIDQKEPQTVSHVTVDASIVPEATPQEYRFPIRRIPSVSSPDNVELQRPASSPGSSHGSSRSTSKHSQSPPSRTFAQLSSPPLTVAPDGDTLISWSSSRHSLARSPVHQLDDTHFSERAGRTPSQPSTRPTSAQSSFRSSRETNILHMKEIGHFMSLVEGKQDKGRDLQNAIEAESARFDKSRISPSFIQGNDDADITSIHSLPLSPSALTHPLDDPTEELTKRSHHSPRSGQSTQTREAGEHDDFTSPATTRRSQKSTTRSHPATPVHPRTADSQSVVSSKTKKRMVTTETVGSLKITTTRPNSHQKTETVTRRPTTRPQTACGFGVNLRRDDNEKEETNNKHKSPRSRSAQPNTSQPNYSNNVEPTPTPTLPLHVLRNDDVGVFLSNTTPFQSLPKIDTQSSPSPTGQTTRKRNIEVSQLKERSSAQNASQNGLKNRTAFEKSSEKMTSQDVEPTDIPLYSVPKIPTLPP